MNRIRVVFCGETTVGKSSIIQTFSGKHFSDQINSTVAGAFHSQFVRVNNETVNLEIWDTAGSERYHSVIPNFFRNAGVVVIIFDLSRKETFSALDFWINFSHANAPEDTPFIVAGNKKDLVLENREISYDEANTYCKNAGALAYFETSAKTGECIENLFISISSVNPNSIITQDTVSSQSVINLDRRSCC